MKKYLISFFLLFIITILSTAAQQIQFEVAAPLSVTQNERFNVSFVLTNAQGENFSEPTFANVDVLAGPIIATGTEAVFANGKTHSKTTLSYTYTLKSHTGIITIGASRITVNGKTLSTKSTKIDVTASASNSPAQSSNSTSAQKSVQGKADILLRLDVNKSTAYKGEAIIATLSILNRNTNISSAENYKLAAFNNFWVQKLDQPTANQRSRTTINGKVYEKMPIFQWLVFPQKTGTLTIEQNSLTLIAQEVIRSGNGYDNGYVDFVKHDLNSPAVNIQVLDLPKPQSATFDGAVGKFSMTTSISGNSLPANSSGTITLKLTGQGNFPLITNPKIAMPAGIELFEAKIKDELQYSPAGCSGSRTIEYPFVTRAEGKYTIPAIEITYFDPSTKAYKNLSSGSLPIEVTQDNNATRTEGAFVSGVSRENLKMLGQDIHFIKVGSPELRSGQPLFLGSASFFIILFIVAALFVGALTIMRKMIAQRGDIVRTKNKKANKVALRRLKRAKHFMETHKNEAFFEEMLRALWGYVGDKLAIEIADLTKERVTNELRAKGVSDDQIELFLQLINQCELAQYAPQVAVPMQQAYEQALEVIGSMELK